MKKNQKTFLYLAGAALLTGVLACGYAWTGADAEPETAAAAPVAQKERPRARNRPRTLPASTKTVSLRPAAARPAARETPEPGRAADRALLTRIEQALERDDLEATLACADAALRSPDVRVREEMVDALGWFSESALPELTPFLADADADVRRAALGLWDQALFGLDDDLAKIDAIEAVMHLVSDRDVLASVSDAYHGLDEQQAVESLARLIQSADLPASVHEQARETYRFITGGEWTDAEGARLWIEAECGESA